MINWWLWGWDIMAKPLVAVDYSSLDIEEPKVNLVVEKIIDIAQPRDLLKYDEKVLMNRALNELYIKAVGEIESLTLEGILEETWNNGVDINPNKLKELIGQKFVDIKTKFSSDFFHLTDHYDIGIQLELIKEKNLLIVMSVGWKEEALISEVDNL